MNSTEGLKKRYGNNSNAGQINLLILIILFLFIYLLLDFNIAYFKTHTITINISSTEKINSSDITYNEIFLIDENLQVRQEIYFKGDIDTVHNVRVESYFDDKELELTNEDRGYIIFELDAKNKVKLNLPTKINYIFFLNNIKIYPRLNHSFLINNEEYYCYQSCFNENYHLSDFYERYDFGEKSNKDYYFFDLDSYKENKILQDNIFFGEYSLEPTTNQLVVINFMKETFSEKYIFPILISLVATLMVLFFSKKRERKNLKFNFLNN
jgi:hypothetical protein